MPTLRTAKRSLDRISSTQKIKLDKLSKDKRLKIENIERQIAIKRKPQTTVFGLHDKIKFAIEDIEQQLKFKILNKRVLDDNLYEVIDIANTIASFKDPLVNKYLDKTEKVGLKFVEQDYKKLQELIKEMHLKQK